MKLLFLLLSAIVATQAIDLKWSPFSDVATEDYLDYDLDQEWENFKRTYARSFHLSNHEENRKNIFADNLREIKHHNHKFSKGVTSYMKGINQFSDMTQEEFKKEMLSSAKFSQHSKKGSTFLPPANLGELPKEVDWLKKGYVTPVKYQGGCQSCWAFSAVGAIEGQHFRKTGKLVSLSEQNLIDCSEENFACMGGYVDKALQYVINNTGIDTEESYPYIDYIQECKFKADSVGATVSGYVNVEATEERLQQAIATIGPISIGINAMFKDYSKGIFDEPDCDPKDINHAVLVVGYGTEDGKDYYLVKNSYDTIWGDNGYVKMSRNKNNQCGIASNAFYPLV